MKYLGHQLTIDFFGCKSQNIDHVQAVEKALLEAARLMQLTVVNSTIHRFNPIGVSGVVVIEESHIAIHTWPEHQYVALDIFTCGEQQHLSKGVTYLHGFFEADRQEAQLIKRGKDVLLTPKRNP